jgi:hypothetical protein
MSRNANKGVVTHFRLEAPFAANGYPIRRGVPLTRHYVVSSVPGAFDQHCTALSTPKHHFSGITLPVIPVVARVNDERLGLAHQRYRVRMET